MKKIIRISFEGESYEVEIDVSSCQSPRKKSMNLLTELRNKSRKECRSFFESYTGQSLSGGFYLTVEAGERLADSPQYHCPLIERESYSASGMIFKMKMLRIKASQIELTNCVFLGDVVFVLGQQAEVMIDKSFVFGNIRIEGNDFGSSVTIQGSLLDRVEFCGDFHSVELNQSSIGWLVFYYANIKEFYVYYCYTEVIRIHPDSKVHFVEKDMFKIDVKKTLTTQDIDEEWVRFPMCITDDEIVQKDYRDAEVERVEDVSEFLDNYKICTTIHDRANLIYYKNLAYLKKPWSCIYKLFGGLINPWIIAIWYMGMIFLFSFFYFYCDSPFGENSFQNLSWCESFFRSLYFSAITITTVGYGDIKPEGWAQIWAAIEGILGVFLGGAFLVAMTRRYFSRET